MAGVKLIQDSRIILLGFTAPIGQTLCAELIELGLQHIRTDILSDPPADGLDWADAIVVRHESGAIWAVPPEGGKAVAILVADDASRAMKLHSRKAGYALALAAPVSARTLYRRLGALLQRRRRVTRRQEPGVTDQARRPDDFAGPTATLDKP